MKDNVLLIILQMIFNELWAHLHWYSNIVSGTVCFMTYVTFRIS